MKVFLDSTVMFNDPFFKANNNKILLKLAKNKEIRLFVSEVVLLETRSNYIKNLSARLDLYSKACREISSLLTREIRRISRGIEEYTKLFDTFYEELAKALVITVVPYRNALLPVIVDRAVNRIRPFTDKKQEFRDCLIWLSYRDYAKKKKFKNCFFISNNVSDFYDEKGEKLHPTLQEDCGVFSAFKTSGDFLSSQKDTLLPKATVIQWDEWFLKHNVDSEYINRVILKQFSDELRERFKDFVIGLDPTTLGKKAALGYLENPRVVSQQIHRWYSNIGDENAIVFSGECLLFLLSDLYDYEDSRKDGRGRYSCTGKCEITLKYWFSFVCNKQGEASKFQIHDMTAISDN